MTFTCVPALLSKRTLTKRFEEEDSTDEKRENGYLFVGRASCKFTSLGHDILVDCVTIKQIKSNSEISQ